VKNLLAIFLILYFQQIAFGQLLPTGSGNFVYNSYSPLRNKPVTVYYNIPANVNANTPILMAFHGEERDGQLYLNDWISASNANNFIVICPEFSDASFTGGDGYNLANMFVDGDNPSTRTQNPDSVWTFAICDPLFQYVKSRTISQVNGYIGWGHSAGSQLLHRFVMYKPNSLMRKAICANAGWYTLPVTTTTFPYGLNASPFTRAIMTDAFSRPLLIQLGAQDNDPNSAGLRHNTTVDAQGLTRLTRGRYFISQGQTQSSSWAVPFNWNKVEEAGIGHDHTGMARRAVPYVIAAFTLTSVEKEIAKNSLRASLSKSGIAIEGIQLNAYYAIQVYGLTGNKIFEWQGSLGSDSFIPFDAEIDKTYIISINEINSSNRYCKLFQIK